MLRNIVLILLLGGMTITNVSFAQVGIGTVNPSPSASLQIDGSNEGLLINRVSLQGKNDTTTISTLSVSDEGLMVYNTNTTSLSNPALNVYPGFYYWDGSQWLAVDENVQREKGWVALTDGDYSNTLSFVNSPLLTDFSNFTNIDLDFTGGADSSIESFAATGYTANDFYDSSASRLTPINSGDAVLLRLQFDATPNQNNGVIVIQLDIGANDIPGDGDDIVIYQKSIPLVRGGGRVTNVSETILLYQLSTFLANGAKLRMAYTRSNNTTGNSCDIDNFGLVIKQL